MSKDLAKKDQPIQEEKKKASKKRTALKKAFMLSEILKKKYDLDRTP